MNKIFLLSLFFSFITFSCSDPNTIGLELQPVSDNIIIGNTTSFKWQNFQTESEDSLRTDEALNLILGEIVMFHISQDILNKQLSKLMTLKLPIKFLLKRQLPLFEFYL